MLTLLVALMVAAHGAPLEPEASRILWAPHPGFQTRAVNAAEFEVAIGGSKGPGKTDLLIIGATRQVDKPAYKAVISRETGPQLDEIKRRMHALYPRMPEHPAWNGDGHGRWNWPSGAVIKLESIGTPEDAAKIQGQEPSFVGQDEVANIKDERTIDLVQAEIRSPDPSIILMWRGTGNPGKAGHHWFKRRFVVPCGRDGKRIILRRVTMPNGLVGELTRRFIPGTVLDNPVYANDPMYLARLMTLPETLRKQLLFGDWDAGSGMALDELDESMHLVPAFDVPDHWTRFGAFDYGYAHWWVWCYFAVQEDGDVYLVDTVRGRRHKPHEIAQRVKARVPTDHPQYIYTIADSYSFQSRKERDDNTPTIADLLLQDHGLVLSPATSTDRVKTLTNLRYYTAWRGIGKGGKNGKPALRFMDTPNNRWGFEQLQSMVLDEADYEDVLKVNADPETGVGGDDFYDSIRTGMGSRPPRAIGQFYQETVRAFSKTTLAHMVETLYKDRPGLTPNTKDRGDLSTFLTGV